MLKELELQLQGSAVALEVSKRGFGGAVMAVRDAEKAVERWVGFTGGAFSLGMAWRSY